MGFNPFTIFKSLRISQENTLTPKVIDIVPGGSASTTTTIQSSQTANRTLTLPNETGTVLTTASTIDPSQLTSLTANRAVVTNGSGKIAASTVTDTEVGYLSGVTSALQTQLDNKAAKNLSNILPVASVDFNAQKLVNVADPSSAQDVSTKAYNDQFLKKDGTNSATADISMGTHKITNVTDPSSAQDVATKNYVDNAGAGANKTLSNLTAPTAANVDLLPATNLSSNLGNSTTRWGTLFASTINMLNTGGFVVKNSGATTLFSISMNANNAEITNVTAAAKISLITSAGEISLSGSQVNANSTKVINVTDPTSAQDAATKNYVDGLSSTIRAYRSSGTQNITSTPAVMVFNGTTRNDGTAYNTSTGSFTAASTGKYFVTAKIMTTTYNLATSQALTVEIRKNGSLYSKNFHYGNGANVLHSVTIEDQIDLVATDTVSIFAYSDVSTVLNAGTDQSIFCVMKIGN